jgi:hypothetical protein
MLTFSYRKPSHADEKRYRPKPKPVRPYGDYYNEDYFYEYRPVQINRRQGGQTWGWGWGALNND